MESDDDKQLEQELVDVLGCWTFDFKPSMALIEKSENDCCFIFQIYYCFICKISNKI